MLSQLRSEQPLRFLGSQLCLLVSIRALVTTTGALTGGEVTGCTTGPMGVQVQLSSLTVAPYIQFFKS